MVEYNAQQQRAIAAPNGPVLIVAGPGTGKTRTLVARIEHLMRQGLDANHILALTFTNKAAREMRARLGKTEATITTFHGLCNQWLSTWEGKKPVFVSDVERQQIIANIKKSRKLTGESVRDLGLRISRAKNNVQPPKDARTTALLDAYNAELLTRGLYDFDDLLLRTHARLQNDSAPRHAMHSQYKAILVDEFQDTNSLQYELLKQLNSTDNVFVIGDPKQSIYGFRGASSGVFEQFQKDWPQALRVTLNVNYRSAPQVVALANAIFSQDEPLTAHQTQAGQVQAMQVLNEYSEARWTLNHIEQAIGGSNMLAGSDHHATAEHDCNFGDFAVLYRTHAVGRILQRLFDESGVPYQVAGEGTPYKRSDIATILNALSYIAGHIDRPAAANFTSTQLQTLLEPLKAMTALPPYGIAKQVIDALGLKREDNQRELQQFLNSLVRFEARPLHAYVKHMQAIAEQEFYDPKADAVTLMTIHAAKGLEFKTVYIIAAEEGILPYYRERQEPSLGEERRLFYVAATRAKQNLALLHAKTRANKPATLSRFVTELPHQVLAQTTDPDMAAQQRKNKLRHYKKAQGSLF